MSITKAINKVNNTIAVLSIAATVVEYAYQTFKWFEKKHGNYKPLSIPKVKGS